ncbi:C2H2-type zinc finger transcription factor [Phycomyces blakesleeanus]
MSTFNEFVKSFVEKSFQMAECFPEENPRDIPEEVASVSDPQISVDLFGSIEQVSQFCLASGSLAVPIPDPFPSNDNLSLGFFSVPSSSFGSFSSVSESLTGYDTGLFAFEDDIPSGETYNTTVLPEFEDDAILSMYLSGQYPADAPFTSPSAQSPFMTLPQQPYSPADLLLSPMAALFPLSPLVNQNDLTNLSLSDPYLSYTNSNFSVSPGLSTEPWLQEAGVSGSTSASGLAAEEAYAIPPTKSSSPGNQIRHQCPYCTHTSNRTNNMKEHIMTHDPNRQKRFICPCCSKAFARKHDLKRHVKSHERHHQYHHQHPYSMDH